MEPIGDAHAYTHISWRERDRETEAWPSPIPVGWLIGWRPREEMQLESEGSLLAELPLH